MKQRFIILMVLLTIFNLYTYADNKPQNFTEIYKDYVQNPDQENKQNLLNYFYDEIENPYYTANTELSKQKKEIVLQIINELEKENVDFLNLSILVCNLFSIQNITSKKAQYFYNELVICVIIIFSLMTFLFILYSQNKVKLKKNEWLTKQAIETQEEERKNISAELHDTICQNLKCVSLQLNSGETKNLVDNSISLLRKLCYNLTPPDIANNDLASAIILYSENFTAKYNIKCEVIFSDIESKEELNSLEIKKQMHIFRIIQEALTNCAKHAGNNVTTCVLCNTFEDNLNIFITDDGNGFNVKEASKTTHFGLVIMKQRADFVGANIEIKSELDSGTTIHLWWKKDTTKNE